MGFIFKKFNNKYEKKNLRSFHHFLLWLLGFYKDKHKPPAIPKNFSYPNHHEELTNEDLITWIGHATFLIQTKKLNIITDPVFSYRCSPLFFIGPRRFVPPKPSFCNLPKIDLIIISHNHYDHLDLFSIRGFIDLNPHIKIVVPQRLKKWLAKRLLHDPNRILELEWFEMNEEFVDAKLTAVPAQHFSGRGVFDRNQTHWMGLVCEIDQKKFYFAGDTGYNEFDFKKIKEKFQKIDLSIIPIGAYLPRKFMRSVHVNPQEAVLIHKEVGSNLSVASHWQTFRLSEEELYRPPFDLFCALENHVVDVKEFRVLEIGQTIAW